MAQTARISCIKEPLLKETLSLNDFGSDDRSDVYCDWIDNFEAIVDFVSFNNISAPFSAKEKNPVFANFLIDLKDSSSSCLISQIPNVYGLLLNDHQWTTAFRMRCFLWPCSVPNDLICRCGQLINLNHLFNCKFNITHRSVVLDAVRDQLYAMCKSHHIEAFVEPLVRRLASENEDENTFGKRRADLITFWV
ncbi:hypothetical protein P9112_010975 [Eukaryota sp. TZLM1-RC]